MIFGIGYGNINVEGNITFGDGKKPVELIEKMLTLSNTDENSIILDFFAGSGTTAHAVMDLNKEEILKAVGGGVQIF